LRVHKILHSKLDWFNKLERMVNLEGEVGKRERGDTSQFGKSQTGLIVPGV
jgi:hypothetical protein